MHDRGDYLSGWQMEEKWNKKQEDRKKRFMKAREPPPPPPPLTRATDVGDEYDSAQCGDR